MAEFNILEEAGEDYNDAYNDSCDPTVSTEFATAAFRFGHSLVADVIRVHYKNLRLNFTLLNQFFDPHFLYEPEGPKEHLLGLLMGAIEQNTEANDRYCEL